jgi:hypothetical protein
LTAAADTAARESGDVVDNPADLAGTLPPPVPVERDPRARPTRQAHGRDAATDADAGSGQGRRHGMPDVDGADDRVGLDDFEPIGVATFGPDPDSDAGPAADTPATADRAEPTGDVCACGGVRPGDRRGAVDIQLKLSTLLCLDEDPGLIPGWGPVIADIARQVALDQEANPTWLWSVTDNEGNLLHHGHTRRRPNATEKAFVKARDVTCRAPGCRQPAMRCDDDHQQEAARGGPSHRRNLCVLCRHHHRLRHERGYVYTTIYGSTGWWLTPDKKIYLNGPDDLLRLTADRDHPTTYSRAHIPVLKPGQDPDDIPRTDEELEAADPGPDFDTWAAYESQPDPAMAP